MLKALLWKEWREQRAVVLAGLCLSLLLPLVIRSSMAAAGVGDDTLLFSQIVTVGTAMVAWPLFAALTAAAAFAERDAGESGYLLSRPVSLAGVWSAKVVVASTSLVVVAGASFAVAQLIHRWYLGAWLAFPFVPGSFSAFALSPTSLAAIVLTGTLLVFACTLLFATTTRSQLVAAALGVTTAAMLVYMGFFLQAALAAQPSISGGSGAFLLAFLGAAAVGILVAASILFHGGIDRHSPRRRGLAATALAAFVVASTVGGAAGVVKATEIDPSRAGRVVIADTIPSHSEALIEVNAGPFKGQSFWLAAPGRPLRQITRRMSDEANVVPGGEWIVYETRRSDWGLRLDSCIMRRVRVDGSGDQPVHDDVPCHAERLFSEDGTRVALRTGRTTVRIVSLDRSSPPRDLGHELPEAEREALEPLRWVNEDRHILLAGFESVRLLDVATGAMSEVFRNPPRFGVDGAAHYRGWTLTPTSSHVLVTAHNSSMALVELASGDVAVFPPPCAGLRSVNLYVAAAGRTYWVICSSGSIGEGVSRIAVLRPGQSEMTVLTTVNGSLGGGLRQPISRGLRHRYFVPSPSGGRLLVTLSEPRDAEGHDRIVHHYVVDRAGELREITGLAYVPVRGTSGDGAVRPADGERWPWGFIGWLDEETLAVSRGGYQSYRPGPQFTELGYIDASMSSPAVFLRIGDQS